MNINIDWTLFAAGTFGFLLGMIFQYIKYQPRIIQQGGWKLGYFLKDNAWRLLLGLIVCAVYSQAMSGHSHALIIIECIAFDRIIDSLTNRKK